MTGDQLRRTVARSFLASNAVRKWIFVALIFCPLPGFASLTAGPLSILSHHRSDDGVEWVIDVPAINPDAEERHDVTARVTDSDPTVRLERQEIHFGSVASGATVHRRLELLVRSEHHEERSDDKGQKAHGDGDNGDDDSSPPPAPPNLTALSFVFDAQIGGHVKFQAPKPAVVQQVISNILPPSPVTGKPLFFQSADAVVEVDPSQADPGVVAMGSCLQWITLCMSPGRSLDDCAVSVPACPAQTPPTGPEMCCPAACYSQYKAARLSGLSDLNASLQTYVDDGSCIPGYKGLTAIKTGQ